MNEGVEKFTFRLVIPVHLGSYHPLLISKSTQPTLYFISLMPWQKSTVCSQPLDLPSGILSKLQQLYQHVHTTSLMVSASVDENGALS